MYEEEGGGGNQGGGFLVFRQMPKMNSATGIHTQTHKSFAESHNK